MTSQQRFSCMLDHLCEIAGLADSNIYNRKEGGMNGCGFNRLQVQLLVASRRPRAGGCKMHSNMHTKEMWPCVVLAGYVANTEFKEAQERFR